jgi:hypothetical protein
MIAVPMSAVWWTVAMFALTMAAWRVALSWP